MEAWPETEAMLGRKSVLTLGLTENGGHVGEEIVLTVAENGGHAGEEISFNSN